MYAVIDIETTGGYTEHERITEIAVFVHDGTRVVDEFISLINPEKRIPPHITRLTGITNEMVERAPKFYEVARRIVEITEGCTFVAHNVSFDYNFVRQEFKNLGYDYVRKRLCTVKLSRSLIPGQPTYSLGKLCSALGIPLEDRHRAAGDARATVKLLELLLRTQEERNQKPLKNGGDWEVGLFSDGHRAILDRLPESPGIYYLHNHSGQVIYVGKSINIRSRVTSHLANSNNRKAMEMKENIADATCEVTGSELIALLRESEEIKRLKPMYNRMLRRSSFPVGVMADYDEHGYVRFSIRKLKGNEESSSVFTSQQEAEGYLTHLAEELTLCQKLSGLYPTSGACFHYQVKKCKGACVQAEPSEDYNARAYEALKRMRYLHPNMVIIDKGRTETEKAIVFVENGHFLGFGYADPEVLSCPPDQLRDVVRRSKDNRHIQQIINQFLREEKAERVIVW
jgi:DNA polymerase-3 subunit epsilon